MSTEQIEPRRFATLLLRWRDLRQPRLGGLRRRLSWSQASALYPSIFFRTLRLQVVIIVLGLALPPLAVVPLDLQARLIDTAIPAGNLRMVAWISAVYAGAVLMTNAIKFAVTYLRGWIEEIVTRSLRAALVDVQRRRTGATAVARLGTVTSAITGEVEDLGAFAAEAINTPLIEGGTLVSLFGFALFAEPRLAAVGMIALAAQGLITPFVQARINRLTRKRITALRRAGLNMIEAAESGDRRRMVPVLREVRHVYRLRLRNNAMKAAVKLLNNVIMHSARIVVFGYGGWLVIRGEIGVGLIVAFLSGLAQIDDHWGELLDFYRRLTDAQVKFRLVAGALLPDVPQPVPEDRNTG